MPTVGLTCNTASIHISDRLYTGELTGKGTRAKGFFRHKNGIMLAKGMYTSEILSECASSIVANILGVREYTVYKAQQVLNIDCSVCILGTSRNIELIPFRDIMSFYRESTQGINSNSYKYIMSIDTYDFIMMQVFDYLTLNTDRNRDNFGLRTINGYLTGLFPIFYRDSCFKGKGTNGVYMPTGLTFSNTLEWLKTMPEYKNLTPKFKTAQNLLNSSNIRNTLTQFIPEDKYNSMCKRANNLTSI